MMWTYLVLVLSFVSMVSLSLQTAWSSRPNPPSARLLNHQIHNDLNRSFQTHREALTVDAWNQSGYTPADLVGNLRAFKRAEPLTSFCEEVSKARPIDLALFEKELSALPCKKELSAKLENFWFVNRMLFQTARNFEGLSSGQGGQDGALASSDTLRTSKAAALSAAPTEVSASAMAPHQIALTFEGDFNPRRAQAILTTLKNYGVQAIYFPSRKAQLHNREGLQTWAKNGHRFGAVLETTKPLHLLPVKEAKELIERSKLSLGTALSPRKLSRHFVYTPASGTPPNKSSELQAIFAASALEILPQTMDSFDWKLTDSRALLDSLLTRIQKSADQGTVLRLHADLEQTVIMLPTLLERLKRDGYELVTFSHSG